MEPDIADQIRQLLDVDIAGQIHQLLDQYRRGPNWVDISDLEENTSDYDSSDSDPGLVFVCVFGPPETAEQPNANVPENNIPSEQAGQSVELAPDHLTILQENEDIRNQLACPICNNLVLSPVTLCRTCGHAVCTNCKKAHRACPTCAGTLEPGSLFVEKILNLCLAKCKFTDFGCQVILSGKDLLEHHKSCEFGHLECVVCDEKVPNELFLEHLRSVEKMEPHMAHEFSFHYTITEEDLASPVRPSGSREQLSAWEPCWLHCFNTDFFCFMDYLAPNWRIWVGAFEPLEVCNEFWCSITVQNEKLRIESEYVGSVHPIQTSRQDVFNSGRFLLLLNQSLKNFLSQGRINVVVSIDKKYQGAKTSKGETVEPTSSRAVPVPPPNWRERLELNPEMITHVHLVYSDDGLPVFIPIPRPGGGLDLP